MSVPLLGPERVVLHSPLSPGACASRLGAALSSPSSEVVGYIGGSSLRLYKRIVYYNSFQTLLRATMHADQRGTRIEARLGVHPLVSAFFVLALGFIVLVGGLHIYGALRSLPFDRVLPQIVGIGTMFLAAFVVPLLGRYFARGEAHVLKEFLRQTLDARQDI